MASRNPVIRISIPTQVSYALGLAFQQSMINTLCRNKHALSEDEQTKKIMAALNIKMFPPVSSDMDSMTYASHIRQRINNSKCPSSSSSDSGDDDDDDDQSSVSSDADSQKE